MTRSLKLDDELVRNAEAITGLSDTAAVEAALRHLIEHHERPTFETLAAQFRALTAERKHTPSEILLREERDGMPIRIEIDDTLIADAMVASGLKSGQAAVEKVLRDYVAQHNMKKAWEELRGMGWHGDLDKIRRGEISPLDERQDAAE